MHTRENLAKVKSVKKATFYVCQEMKSNWDKILSLIYS